MSGERTVNRPLSVRYPEWKRKLLESVSERRGDLYLSETIAAALDQLIEQSYPGTISRVEAA